MFFKFCEIFWSRNPNNGITFRTQSCWESGTVSDLVISDHECENSGHGNVQYGDNRHGQQSGDRERSVRTKDFIKTRSSNVLKDITPLFTPRRSWGGGMSGFLTSESGWRTIAITRLTISQRTSHVLLRIFGFLSRCGDGIESDVCEEARGRS